MLFREVSSVAEGLDYLDDNPDTLATYAPFVFDDTAQSLSESIVNHGTSEIGGITHEATLAQLRWAFNKPHDQFTLPIHSHIVAPDDKNLLKLREYFGDTTHVQQVMSAAQEQKIMRLALGGGALFTSTQTNKPFNVACGRRDILITRFVMQSGNDYMIAPDFHPDVNDLTVCVYLEGHGLKYKDTKGNIHRLKLKGPVAYMHRGQANEMVKNGLAEAVQHSGFAYADGERRTSLSFSLSDEMSVSPH